MNDAIRQVRHEDIPAAIRLKDAAGWNQTVEDWECLLELEPAGCFCIESPEGLAATATSVCYGQELAWIGMVLTAPAYRGRGFARRLMEHTLEFLRRREVAWIKLDATDMGRPLYASLGFEDECPIERWRGVGVGSATLPAGFLPGSALDRQAFGADRSRLLRVLSRSGHALGRPGTKAAYFGPCVARTAADARALLAHFLSLHAGQPVYWDLLPDNPDAKRLAEEFGFAPVRRLSRMALRGKTPFVHDDSLVYAIAGFEVG